MRAGRTLRGPREDRPGRMDGAILLRYRDDRALEQEGAMSHVAAILFGGVLGVVVMALLIGSRGDDDD